MSWPAGLPNKKADSKITVTQDLIVYALRSLLCHKSCNEISVVLK